MAISIFSADNGVGNTELWRTDAMGRTSLVKEIRAGANGSGPSNFISSGPSTSAPFAVLNNVAYFLADDGVNGAELWRSDGTSGGTTMVTQFAGSTMGVPNGYAPTNILVANNKLFFNGNGPSGGGIYWTDGSSVPTFVAATIGLTGFTASGTRVYWSQDTGLGDSGLWTSDGNAAPQQISTLHNNIGVFDVGGGTAYFVTSTSLSKVAGITVTPVTGAPGFASNFTNIGGTVYFIQSAGGGTSLWKTTTATATASQVKTGLDFTTAPPSFATVNGLLIFTSTDAVNGTELWKSDGTSGGTIVLKDIVTGATNGVANSGNPKSLVTVGSKMFFQASDGAGGVDLWRTDGTTGGTVLVKHIASANPASSGSTAAPELTNMTEQNGVLLFGADIDGSGIELWRSDGTARGTVRVSEINTSTQASASFDASYPVSVAAFGGITYFLGYDLAHGYELWSSDGTVGGTAILKDINPGFLNSGASNLLRVGSQFFFTADDGAHGKELWVSNGTAGGTRITKDINLGPTGSIASFFNSQFIAPFGNKVLFAADDGSTGQELWISDGTSAGTLPLGNLNPGSTGGIANGSFPSNFVTAGSNAFFIATNIGSGAELWVTDGTPGGGTHITKDILLGANSSNVQSMIAFGNKVAFVADDGAGGFNSEVWLSDGSPGGTQILKDINPVLGQSSNPFNLTVANGKLLFIANDGGLNGPQVWASDGTGLNTSPLTSTANFQPQSLTGVGNLAYFSAFTAASGYELYATNGIGAPSLININPTANQGSNPSNLTAVGNKLFFVATDTTAHGAELWVSTGTTLATTSLVNDINLTPNTGSNPSSLTAVGNLLFFVANDGTHGDELWVSDGIPNGAGTHLLKDINTTPNTGASISALKATINGHLLFQANDGVNGNEQWITDGTTGGTIPLSNVVQPNGANPSGFTSVPGTLDTGPEVLIGTNLDDVINGLTGGDNISGLGGNDTLDGGTGADILLGGFGDDWYFVDNAGDIIVEPAGQGTLDRAFASASYTLTAGAEIEVFSTNNHTGVGPINLTGNEFIDTITGNDGDNILNGAGGADLVTGRLGNDWYFVDNAGDQIVEIAGQGAADRVFASLSYTLPAAAEIETFSTADHTGTTPINLTGNGFVNALIGNDGDNVLDGKGGADTTTGRAGNDIYFVDNAGDTIAESAGQGTLDRVYASVSYALPAGAEIEALATTDKAGLSSITLTGNALGDTISGNDGSNALGGLDGSDTLIGNGGGDAFVFNTVPGAGNVDHIVDFNFVAANGDQIVLHHGIFTALAAGALPASAYRIATAALDADDHVIYNPNTGELLYDADGVGGAAAVRFAVLDNLPNLAETQFLVA